MTRYAFIEIIETGRSPSGKTAVFEVRNRKSDDVLGRISWYGAWRQYTFDPEPRTTYSAGCLRDIARFLDAARSGR